ncbi:MAG: cohesin domain-containing protein, partial [Candidatus Latescibacterota bacterium]
MGLALPTQVELAVGQQVRVPLSVGDLTGREVYSYLLTFTYDDELTEVRGVRTAGTLSDSMDVVVNSATPGQITVVASQATPLSGQGALLELEVLPLARGVARLQWVSASLNEGDPSVQTVDGALQMQVGSGHDVAVGFGEVVGQSGDTGVLPITVDDLTGNGVVGYAFAFSFDPGVFQVTGASVDGTVSAGMTALVNTVRPGLVAVSAAGQTALEGSGTLLELQVAFTGHGASPLVWQEVQLNEGDPGATTADGSLRVQGEVVVRGIGHGASAGADWVEMVVLEDGLDLRGYQVQDASGDGFRFADDPVWRDLASGTVVLVGGEASGVPERVAWAQFRVSVSQPSLLIDGPGLALDASSDAVQVRDAQEGPVFGVGWGTAAGLLDGLHLDMGSAAVLAGTSLVYRGGSTRGVTEAAAWATGPFEPAATAADGGAGQVWIDSLRLAAGGALTVILPQGTAAQVGEVVHLPVALGSLAGRDVLAYGFTLAYDPALIEVLGITTTGTRSEGMTAVTNGSPPGHFTAVASGVSPAGDAGPLVVLDVRCLDRGEAQLRWTDFTFNEGQPVAAPVDGWISVRAGAAEGIEVRLPEVVAVQGTTERLAIGAGDLTGQGIHSYMLTIIYDPTLMTIQEVVQEGTLSQGMELVSNTGQAGIVTVAASQADPLVGGGALFELAVTYAGSGTGELRWQQFAFDEGVLAALADGSLQVSGAITAGADTAVTPEDTSVQVAAVGNDTDPEGDPLSITGAGQPAHGTVLLDAGDTTLTYTPAADFHGEDTFTYTVSDPGGATATGTVLVTVAAVNDPPAAPLRISPADAAALARGSVTFAWTAAPDADGDPVTYTVVVKAGAFERAFTTSETTLQVDLATLGLPATALTVTWSVSASDGLTTVGAADGEGTLELESLEPEIAVSLDTVAFQPAVVGETQSLSLTVVNRGTVDLVVSGITSTVAQILASIDIFAIPPGGSGVVEVEYTPLLPGVESGVLTIASNDPGRPAVTVALTAQVAGLTVWPGDTNDDGQVDGRDVLPIGVYWHVAGAARPGPRIDWAASGVAPWAEAGACRADANGNGMVDAEDILPV